MVDWLFFFVMAIAIALLIAELARFRHEGLHQPGKACRICDGPRIWRWWLG